MSFRSLFGRKTAPRQHSPEPVTSPPPPVILSAEDHEKLALLLRLVNERSEPNLNRLMEKIRDLDIMALNLKATGYQLARRLMSALPHGEPTQARHVGLSWKPCTQSDMESDWVRHWCNELKTPLVFHRKLWELAYVLQAGRIVLSGPARTLKDDPRIRDAYLGGADAA